MLKMLKRIFKTKKSAGFSLYEVIISLAIITIIAGIALYDHNRFNTDIEVTNLAYRVALAFREAQADSISVKQYTNSARKAVFDLPYGVHFNKSRPTDFVIFGDGDGDGKYTNGDPDDMICDPSARGSECMEHFSIGRGNTIMGWCAFSISNPNPFGQSCSWIDNDDAGNYLDVVFRRPNPDAAITMFGSQSDTAQYMDAAKRTGLAAVCNQTNSPNQPDCSGVAICLLSPAGRLKRVVVRNTGQISVESVGSASGRTGVDYCNTSQQNP